MPDLEPALPSARSSSLLLSSLPPWTSRTVAPRAEVVFRKLGELGLGLLFNVAYAGSPLRIHSASGQTRA